MSSRLDAAMPEADGAEARLAAESAALRWEDIPEDVMEIAVDCVLDAMAVALGASQDETVRLVTRVTDTGPCTRLADGASVGARSAALANATAIHALDFDDWLPAGGLHPSAPLLPAALAQAESAPPSASGDATGRRLLTAYIAGFEAQARIGAAMAPGHYAAGFHPTATVGTFGAAAAVAHQLGLGPAAIQRAWGLAATQAAGLRAVFGTMGKPLQVGRAAETGLLAARLAAAGATAPADAVFGPRGFATTHSSTIDLTPAMVPFAEQWYLRDVLFKRHAACFGTHATINALLELRRGVDPTRVDAIELTVPELLRTVCAIPLPRTPLEAKFSLAFTAALALVKGRCQVSDFAPEQVRDTFLLSVAERVRVRFVADLPPQQTQMRLHLADGTTRWAISDSAQAPTRAQRRMIVREKFTALAPPALGAERAKALLTAIEGLPVATTMSQITASIRPA
ncbi:MmgE/PrpD family protein [Streptomyces sp. NPDC006602]|uniref:MmgE/PrpD family protein n=1 Tax=Streptomyces sp. NPDC006602 TaxID=3364751 RepID=UPI003678D7F7